MGTGHGEQGTGTVPLPVRVRFPHPALRRSRTLLFRHSCTLPFRRSRALFVPYFSDTLHLTVYSYSVNISGLKWRLVPVAMASSASSTVASAGMASFGVQRGVSPVRTHWQKCSSSR